MAGYDRAGFVCPLALFSFRGALAADEPLSASAAAGCMFDLVRRRPQQGLAAEAQSVMWPRQETTRGWSLRGHLFPQQHSRSLPLPGGPPPASRRISLTVIPTGQGATARCSVQRTGPARASRWREALAHSLQRARGSARPWRAPRTGRGAWFLDPRASRKPVIEHGGPPRVPSAGSLP
jgi:hypothetical protein